MMGDHPRNPPGPVLTRAQSRWLDQLAIEQYGMSSLVLMENAGRGAVDVLCRLKGCFDELPAPSAGGLCQAGGASSGDQEKAWSPLPGRHWDWGGPVIICCGRGNNAGDGLVMARHLWLRGHPVRVLLWSKPEELSPDAAANYRILEKAGFPIEGFLVHDPDRLDEALSEACWIVDALLGTGARGQPRPPLDRVIAQLNQSGKPILAVDIPSGLDCNTGRPGQPTIRATVTCTFAAAKTGLIRPEAQEYVGRLVIVDIGTPPPLLSQVLTAPAPEPPSP